MVHQHQVAACWPRASRSRAASHTAVITQCLFIAIGFVTADRVPA